MTARTWPTRVVEVELAEPVPTLTGLDAYAAVLALVRVRSRPVGTVRLPVRDGAVSSAALAAAIADELRRPVAEAVVAAGLAEAGGPRHPIDIDPTAPWEPTGPPQSLPVSVTVAVCTRDRPRDLATCLAAIAALDAPGLEVLVVDNAPSSDATETVVAAHPGVRYVREPRPGLDWARNRAVLEATGEVVAFTDDDVVVDRHWARAIAAVFAEEPHTMAVTGLVVPFELESEAQVRFEQAGGFGRGFARRWYRADVETGERAGRRFGGAGLFGTGANMAFRRAVFADVGLFDPALDVGTVTNGGGDLEMLFRVVKGGHVLAYEPAALVRHRHRRTLDELRRQLANNGIGLTSHLVRTMSAYPEERGALLVPIRWIARHHLRRLAAATLRPGGFPRQLVLDELGGFLVGLPRYGRARRRVAEITAEHGPQLTTAAPPSAEGLPGPAALGDDPEAVAVRSVDLSEALPRLGDLDGFASVRVFVSIDGRLIGHVDIDAGRRPVSASRLRTELAANLWYALLRQWPGRRSVAWEWDLVLAQRWARAADPPPPRPSLPADVPVSVVVATLDRPDHLRACLAGLLGQESNRPIEVVVVDNNPASGLTRPVVAAGASRTPATPAWQWRRATSCSAPTTT